MSLQNCSLVMYSFPTGHTKGSSPFASSDIAIRIKNAVRTKGKGRALGRTVGGGFFGSIAFCTTRLVVEEQTRDKGSHSIPAHSCRQLYNR